MAKMKVHELAKELEKQSKELIAFLQDKGYEVKAAQSSIEDEAIELVRRQFGGKDAVKAESGQKPVAETKKENASKMDTKSEAAASSAVAKSETATSKTAPPPKEDSSLAAPKADAKPEAVVRDSAKGETAAQGRPAAKAPAKQNPDARKSENGKNEPPKKKKSYLSAIPSIPRCRDRGSVRHRTREEITAVMPDVRIIMTETEEHPAMGRVRSSYRMCLTKL